VPVTRAGRSATAWSPDSVGWPCLCFTNNKVYAEQLVPITSGAAEAIRARQAEVARCWPVSPRLFPALTTNPDGARAFTLRRPAPAHGPPAGRPG